MEGQENTNGGGAGPVIGIIIILAVVVLGGLYFWNERRADDALIDETEVELTETELETEGEVPPPAEPIIETDFEFDTEINAS